ncbi:hypothetical protein [Streptomyces olivaceoviridis]|uniref:hypothetical protein n=1 Tax=Streptomyces olivaceoviridis TaxID=1921 RepID=UPI00331F7791
MQAVQAEFPYARQDAHSGKSDKACISDYVGLLGSLVDRRIAVTDVTDRTSIDQRERTAACCAGGVLLIPRHAPTVGRVWNVEEACY